MAEEKFLEYKVIDLHFNKTKSEWEEALNYWGVRYWRVVSMVPDGEGYVRVTFMKEWGHNG